MQAQAVVHVGTGKNMMNQTRREHDEPDGNVLSRGGHPLWHWSGATDQVRASRCK